MIPALAVFESAATGQIRGGYSWMGYERGSVPASALFGATPFGLEPQGYVRLDVPGRRRRAPQGDVRPFKSTRSCAAPSRPRRPAGSLPDRERRPAPGPQVPRGRRRRRDHEGGRHVGVRPFGRRALPGASNGVLDATEFSLPTVDKQLGFDQVAKFYHLPGWHQPLHLAVPLRQHGRVERPLRADAGPLETTCMAGTVYAMARGEALRAPSLPSSGRRASPRSSFPRTSSRRSATRPRW